MLIDFVTQSYRTLSGAISSSRLVNLFAEREPPDTKTPIALLGAPGISSFADAVGDGPIRQMRGMGDFLYAVSGSDLYKVDSAGAATLIGSVGPFTGTVTMSDIGRQLLILNNGEGYLFRVEVLAVLAAAAATGATTLTLTFDNSIASMQSGDAVEVQLDNGSIFATTLASAPVQAAITMAAGLPSAASIGQLVTDTVSTSTSTGTVVANAIADATVLYVDSIEGFTAADTITVGLDNGKTFDTTISSLTAGPTVTLALGMPSPASAGLLLRDTVSRLTKITDVNFKAAKTVTAFDDYFVMDVDGKDQFYMSTLGDGGTYPYFYYATAFANPSKVLAVVADHEFLLVFCERGIETWYDAGTAQFPFARYNAATIERGCGAALTVLKEDNGVFFLGNDLVFYRLQGPLPIRVSNHAQEEAWSKYSVTSDAFAYSFTYGGHKFVVLTFPTADATWVYDVSTKLWHERDSVDSSGNYVRWRGNCAWSMFNKILIGDRLTNRIGRLDWDTFTEYTVMMRGQAIGSAVRQDRARMFISRFELEVDAGVGTTVTTAPIVYLTAALPSQATAGNLVFDTSADPSVPGFKTTLSADALAGATNISVISAEDIGWNDSITIFLDDGSSFTTTVKLILDPNNPKIYLDYTDDGGQTWSTPSLPRSMGANGARQTRLRWLRLGQSRQRFFRVTIFDTVKRVIVAAYADITPGM